MRSDTRRRLLDAAITLVAEGGLRALTHRTLENAAGASRGSTTYHLGNRQQIVEALLRHLADLDASDLNDMLRQLAFDSLLSQRVDMTTMSARTVRTLVARPERVICRYTLMLEAARDEALRPIVRRWRSMFIKIPESVFAQLGAPDPAGAAKDLVAYLDGVIFEHLATGEPGLESRLTAGLTSFALSRLGGALPDPPEPPDPSGQPEPPDPSGQPEPPDPSGQPEPSDPSGPQA